MAVRGRKPKPPALKVVTGNPGKRPLPEGGEVKIREGELTPPRKLTKAQQSLWTRYINTAWWLTEHDAPKAYMWVALEAQFERAPTKMVAAMIGQLRSLGSELGLDPAARTRMAGASAKKKDPTDEFFE